MEFKHTPGPWVADDPDCDMRISAGDKTIVGGCGCCGSPYGVNDMAEHVANAHLVAAAPDMVDAIWQILDWWENSAKDRYPAVPHCIFAAQKAMACLKGEYP